MSMQSINNSCEDLGKSVFNCKICKGSKKERINILLLSTNDEIVSIFKNKCNVFVLVCAGVELIFVTVAGMGAVF